MPEETTPPPVESLGGTALRSIGWLALAKWVNRFFSLIVFAVLGRLLDPADIGLAALAAVFIAVFSVLADQGFSSALIQKSSLDQDDRNTAFWVNVVSASVLACLVLVLAPAVADLVDQPRLTGVLRALTPMLLMSAMAGAPAALLERDFDFRVLSLRTLFGSFVGGVVGLAAAFMGAGVWSIVAQSLTSSFVILVVLWSASSWKPGLRTSRRALRELRSVGLSVLSIQVVGLASAQSDKLIVGGFLGARELGYYFIGQRLVAILLEIQTSVIEGISLTTLSKMRGQRRRLAQAFYRLTGASAAIAIFTFSLLAATAPVVIPLVFGSQWTDAVVIMQIFCLAGCINCVIVFDRNALIAVGATRAALMITAVQAVVGLGSMFAAVPLGVVAVAVAATARQYLVWPLRLRSLRTHLHISVGTYLGQWLGPMLSGALVFAASLGITLLWNGGSGRLTQVAYLLLQGVVGAVLYFASLRLTSRRTFNEFERLLHAARRRSRRARAV